MPMIKTHPQSDVQRVGDAVPALLAESIGGMRAVRVNGNIRKDDALLNHGDILAVDPHRFIADGEIALLNDGDHLVLRRVYREAGGVRLEPLDPRYDPTQTAAMGDLDVQGRVAAIIRKVEEIEDDS